MISGFPAPYPDELVGSLFSRATRHTGLSWKELNRRVRGADGQSNYISWVMSSPLLEIAPHARTNASELLWKHTMFAYATAFLARSLVDTLEARILAPVKGRKRPLTPIAQSITQGVTHRRFCSVCAEADGRLHGETYWHRSHNLPGVYRCHVHGVPLRETLIPVRYDMHHRVDAMPGETSSYVKHFALGPAPMVDIARRSVAFLAHPAPPLWQLAIAYRKQALALGFGNERYLASADLANRLQRFYGKPFLELAGASFDASSHAAWPALLPRLANDTAVAPSRHVLFQTFLAFAERFDGDSTRRGPGPRPRDMTALDRTVTARLTADLHSDTTCAWRAPIKTWLTGLGCWGMYRHNRPHLPSTTHIVTRIVLEHRAQRARRAKTTAKPAAAAAEAAQSAQKSGQSPFARKT